jgi:hypothetical protein
MFFHGKKMGSSRAITFIGEIIFSYSIKAVERGPIWMALPSSLSGIRILAAFLITIDWLWCRLPRCTVCCKLSLTKQKTLSLGFCTHDP